MGAVTETEEKPDTTGNDFGNDLEHYCCTCSINVAFCGADLSDAEYVEYEETPDDCVVCVELKDRPCERCGAA